MRELNLTEKSKNAHSKKLRLFVTLPILLFALPVATGRPLVIRYGGVNISIAETKQLLEEVICWGHVHIGAKQPSMPRDQFF